MINNNFTMKLVLILLVLNGIFLAKWLIDSDNSEVYAQEINKAEIGRYQLQYVPTVDGSDPRYLLLDTATGIFWEAKGYIENVDNFCIYSASDLKIAKIGNHTVSVHKHK